MKILTKIAGGIDEFNQLILRLVSWLALFMVLVQIFVVIMRYVFGTGSIQLQESIIYMHGILFMLAAAGTLLADDHVRVDIFIAVWGQKAGRGQFFRVSGFSYSVLPAYPLHRARLCIAGLAGA